MRRFSRSELWTFKRCRRRWYLGTYRRLKRRGSKPGPDKVGVRVHDALAAAYTGPVEGIDQEAAFESLRHTRKRDKARWEAHESEKAQEIEGIAGKVIPVSEQAESWKRWQAIHDLSEIMVTGYFEWLEETGMDAHLTVVSAEEELTVPFEVPAFAHEQLALVGKLDLRAIDHSQGDAKVFVDHKTTQSFSDIEQAVHMNEQLLHYHLLELLRDLETEERTQGGIFNMLRRVKRTPSAKPPFYKRVTAWHNIDELRSYYLRVRGTAADILRVTYQLGEEGANPLELVYPTPDKSCSWQCPYYAVCPMIDDPHMDSEGFLAMAYEEHDPMERYVQLDLTEG